MLGWLLPPYSALPMQMEDDPSPATSSPLAMSSAPKVCPNTLQAPGKVLVLVCASWELFQFSEKELVKKEQSFSFLSLFLLLRNI